MSNDENDQDMRDESMSGSGGSDSEYEIEEELSMRLFIAVGQLNLAEYSDSSPSPPTAAQRMAEAKLKKERKVAFGILEYLNQEFNHQETSADRKESLEVAMQCLETAYGVTVRDTQYKSAKTLGQLYEDLDKGPVHTGCAGAGEGAIGPDQLVARVELGPDYPLPPVASDANKALAEDLKNKGNDAMRNCNYSEAMGYYNQAVELDGRNSVFFCNRAAAHLKLEHYDESLRDCQIAIRLQPNYARAYGRMGVTYSSRDKHVDAILCYKKALELEPENESYLTNLRYAQQQLARTVTGQPGGGGGGGIGGMEELIRNPHLINMASQMLGDPNMQNIIQGLMSRFTGAGGGENGGDGNAGPDGQAPNPIENLMQMGQTIANQIRSTNPQLAEQLGVGTIPTEMDFSPSNASNPPNAPPQPDGTS